MGETATPYVNIKKLSHAIRLRGGGGGGGGGCYHFAKSIDSCQPAHSAQADMGRNFSLSSIFLHVKGFMSTPIRFYGTVIRRYFLIIHITDLSLYPFFTDHGTLAFLSLSPPRWHGKHTYLSSLGMLGTTQPNFICRSHNI